jgi:hypothetical protein
MIARSTSASVRSAQGIAAVIGGKPERYQSGGTSATLPINQKINQTFASGASKY